MNRVSNTFQNNPNNSVATLIHWKDGTDRQRILKWLDALQEKGVIQASYTGDYNSEHGEPVWYIP